MICYICNRQVSKSLKVDELNFGYCEKHQEIVQIGVVKYILTHQLDYLHNAKMNEAMHARSAAMVELQKQLDIEDFLQND